MNNIIKKLIFDIKVILFLCTIILLLLIIAGLISGNSFELY